MESDIEDLERLINHQKCTKAKNKIIELLIKNPNDYDTNLLLLRCLFLQHDSDGVISLCREKLSIWPDDKNLSLYLVKGLISSEQYAEAECWVAELKLRFPNDVDVLIQQATLFLAKNKNVEAKEVLDEIITIDRTCIGGYRMRGILLTFQYHQKSGLSDFSSAWKIARHTKDLLFLIVGFFSLYPAIPLIAYFMAIVLNVLLPSPYFLFAYVIALGLCLILNTQMTWLYGKEGRRKGILRSLGFLITLVIFRLFFSPIITNFW
jgi:tetratricopeptide (TPR) repeat protein